MASRKKPTSSGDSGKANGAAPRKTGRKAAGETADLRPESGMADGAAGPAKQRSGPARKQTERVSVRAPEIPAPVEGEAVAREATGTVDLSDEIAGLLGRAGIHRSGDLAAAEAVSLHRSLELLAWQSGRASLAPSLEQVAHWIKLAGAEAPGGGLEFTPLEDIPEAEITPAGAAWIPPAHRAAREAAHSPAIHLNPARQPAPENAWRKVNPAQFATIEDYNEGRMAVQPLSRGPLGTVDPEEEPETGEGEAGRPSRRKQRIRSQGEDLSRWVVRGVVHPRPFHVWLGALVSVVWRLALVTGVAGFLYLLIRVENPSAYRVEVIAGFAVLVVLGLIQLHFASRSRCRICSCNLFYSKNCHKNRKAHHIPGFGYVGSLALHLLLFRWFRCMYCGTAIRLSPAREARH